MEIDGLNDYSNQEADLRLIPSSVRDDRAIAFLQLIWGLLYFDTARLKVYNIDTVQSDVIPHLLQQFRLESFLPDNLPEERRRALLKRAIEIWRYIGTRHGIKLVAEISLGITISFTEWWQYSGTPHTFVVSLSVDGSQGSYLGDLGTVLQGRLIALINTAKPARSHLLRLDVSVDITDSLPIGVYREKEIIVFDLPKLDNFETHQHLGVGMATNGIMLLLR